MNADEFRRSDPPSDIEFADVDVNKDGMIEFTEVVAFSCTCENELNSMMDQLPFKTSTEFFESLDLRNTYDLKFLDENGDDYITQDELEEAIENCKTTFNPFDTDGDGVPNVDDQFPNDPSESKDADGDGIGDNADDDDDGDGVSDLEEMSCVNTVSPTDSLPPSADMSPLGPDDSTIGAAYILSLIHI